MHRAMVAALALVGSIAGIGLVACSTPAPEPKARWTRTGAGDHDLETDRRACLEEAARTSAATKRFDHVAKGSAFMVCMTDRGWRQVPVEP